MIRNLGQVLCIIAADEAREHATIYEFADRYHTREEPFAPIRKRNMQLRRLTRRRAEAVARRPYRIIKREAARRGCDVGGPRWERLVHKLLADHHGWIAG